MSKALNKCSVAFETIAIEEIKHRKQYTVQVNIGGVSFETAVNYSIKSAEQLVAEKAFKRIEEEQGREKIYEINKESDE